MSVMICGSFFIQRLCTDTSQVWAVLFVCVAKGEVGLCDNVAMVERVSVVGEYCFFSLIVVDAILKTPSRGVATGGRGAAGSRPPPLFTWGSSVPLPPPRRQVRPMLRILSHWQNIAVCTVTDQS